MNWHNYNQSPTKNQRKAKYGFFKRLLPFLTACHPYTCSTVEAIEDEFYELSETFILDCLDIALTWGLIEVSTVGWQTPRHIYVSQFKSWGEWVNHAKLK